MCECPGGVGKGLPFFLPRRLIEFEYFSSEEADQEYMEIAESYQKDIDFAFFVVNFGYSRSDYDALTGLTLAKGFNRLTGIDDAKAKLKGLGHDAESVTEIMNSAMESVKGTSYGMDAAATTAASAVAAGIQPGKELTRYLSLTADAAAIAGASMADMGSIINKVQTSQIAYTDDLNQLADRGLPIYQWLAEAAGITAAQVKEMASEGQISSQMFLDAIEKNIGGAAKIKGESSFTAAISNIGASISRIGANFLDAGGKGGGFFSTLKPMLTDFNNFIRNFLLPY